MVRSIFFAASRWRRQNFADCDFTSWMVTASVFGAATTYSCGEYSLIVHLNDLVNQTSTLASRPQIPLRIPNLIISIFSRISTTDSNTSKNLIGLTLICTNVTSYEAASTSLVTSYHAIINKLQKIPGNTKDGSFMLCPFKTLEEAVKVSWERHHHHPSFLSHCVSLFLVC